MAASLLTPNALRCSTLSAEIGKEGGFGYFSRFEHSTFKTDHYDKPASSITNLQVLFNLSN